ncbi:ATP-binding protein [Streptomyces ipomoeae]|uniref:ATP-binding protein n=1 Tax=Streptomyces ipomoeae TaxID=103232 RepID=UPI0029B8D86A|nr:ATP-binding protein [Streptomyces ipomoeae]MDX2693676.1 ATP-binding protein [Streptomyces ipomoeae]MDX2838387.1 ATP-binding protein [Streptomyces ipomoeae]
MDPMNRGPEEYGHDDGQAHAKRPPRDALAQDFAPHTPALARTVQLVSGDFLLTVNPVDGSEIENCPPGELPGRPEKHASAERDRAARPPVPPGPSLPRLPLLQRDDERERLVRLLARGRSVRLTGAAGSGRTTLLDAVAEDCADLAPDGVVRLSGHRRSPGDLLYDLFAAVYSAPLFRPTQEQILDVVRDIGAVVVLDDLEFGGAALDELLDATPECAFLLAATPDVPLPSADAPLEEIVLGGFDRAGSLELLARAVGRDLTEEEVNWAGDLLFESEGLPLRFTQAGALLRQRDRLRAGADAVDEFGVFADAPPVDPPYDTAADDHTVPLPSLAEGAAPAALLASRLSESARETLRFAVALGGEVPHQAHLPALVGDTHADAALGELVGCALVTPVGARYRLAAGVRTQLEAAGYADDIEERARTAAQHYAWWAGHPSVTPERVAAEADAVLAALTVIGTPAEPAGEGEESVAVRLARQAAPAFAAGLHWNAWDRALHAGAEAARLAEETGDQAYFHHELGVLALCLGELDRARAELEASIALRGALADKRGTVAGRRALALVADRSGATPPGGRTAAGEEVPDARHEESASPPGGVPSGYVPTGFASMGAPATTGAEATLVTNRPGAVSPAPGAGGLKGVVLGARRNLAAVGAGALLAAVLGTVVTLGATSDNNTDTPSEKIGVNPSVSEGTDNGRLGAEEPKKNPDNNDPGVLPEPTDPGPDGTYGTADDPTPTDTAGPSDDAKPSPSDPSTSSDGGTTSGSTGGSTGGTDGGTTGGTTGGTDGGTSGGTTGGTTGGTADGGTTGGTTDGGTTDGGTTDGTTGGTDGGTTDGGTTGSTDGGTTDGGTTDGTTGGTDGGTTDGTTGGTSSPSDSMSASAPESSGEATPGETTA